MELNTPTPTVHRFHTPPVRTIIACPHEYETIGPIPEDEREHWEAVFSTHYFFDTEQLTNINGFFHDVYLGWRVETTWCGSYIGPLVRYPHIRNLLVRALASWESFQDILRQSHIHMSRADLAHEIQAPTGIYFIADKSEVVFQSARRRKVRVIRRLCDIGNVEVLDREGLSRRMFEFATMPNRSDQSFDDVHSSSNHPFPISLTPAQYQRRGLRPEAANRRLLSSGGDWYLDGSGPWQEASVNSHYSNQKNDEELCLFQVHHQILSWAQELNRFGLSFPHDYLEECLDYDRRALIQRRRLRTRGPEFCPHGISLAHHVYDGLAIQSSHEPGDDEDNSERGSPSQRRHIEWNVDELDGSTGDGDAPENFNGRNEVGWQSMSDWDGSWSDLHRFDYPVLSDSNSHSDSDPGPDSDTDSDLGGDYSDTDSDTDSDVTECIAERILLKRRELPRSMLTSIDLEREGNCPICQDAGILGTEVIVLDCCEHWFCIDCITEWLEVAPTPNCPFCRATMLVPLDDSSDTSDDGSDTSDDSE